MKRCIICGHQGDGSSTVCEICGNPYIDISEMYDDLETADEMNQILDGVSALPEESDPDISEDSMFSDQEEDRSQGQADESEMTLPEEPQQESTLEEKQPEEEPEQAFEQEDIPSVLQTETEEDIPSASQTEEEEEKIWREIVSKKESREDSGVPLQKKMDAADAPVQKNPDAVKTPAPGSKLSGENSQTQRNVYGQGSQPQRRAPYGQGVQPQRRAPYGQGVQPQGRAPYGQGVQPQGRAPYGQGVQLQGRAPYGQGGQPQGRAPYGQGGQPQGRAPRNQNNQFQRRPANQPQPSGAAIRQGTYGQQLMQEARRAIHSPVFLIMTVLYTAFIAASVVSAFMQNLSFSQIIQTLTDLNASNEIMTYADKVMSLLSRFDSGALVIILISRIPDALLCIGFWAAYLTSGARSKKMSGFGFLIAKIVLILKLFIACILLLVCLLLAVTFVVSAWVSGLQATKVASVIFLAVIIVLTMMVIMFFFCCLHTVKVCKLNAVRGEEAGKASAYAAVLMILAALLSAVSLLSAVVNVEIAGIVSSACSMGWMILLGVWILMYRSKVNHE